MPSGVAFYPEDVEVSPAKAQIRISTFIRRVYAWMFLGLCTTAGVSLVVATSPALMRVFFAARWPFFALVIAELALVVVLSARAAKMSAGAAGACFFLYSALNGVTLAPIFFVYTGASIASTFMVSAAMFGALALWGTFTKRNLTSLGHFFGMGLIGLILASVVGLFWQDSGLQFAIAVVGVIVFVGLTAYDAQKLKVMALATPGGPSVGVAVVGALALYLDFINLFLMLLRLFGRRR